MKRLCLYCSGDFSKVLYVNLLVALNILNHSTLHFISEAYFVIYFAYVIVHSRFIFHLEYECIKSTIKKSTYLVLQQDI